MAIQLGPEWRTFDQRLGRTAAVLEFELTRTIYSSLMLIEADARANVSRDTGRLGSSINNRITGAYPLLVGEVGPTLRYGRVVEFGRRRGARMPPVDALIGWVRRHFSPNRAAPVAAGPRRNRAWRAAGDDQLRSRAFALARAIQRRGIPERPFMRPAFTRNRPRIELAFRRIGIRVVGYLAGSPIR